MCNFQKQQRQRRAGRARGALRTVCCPTDRNTRAGADGGAVVREADNLWIERIHVTRGSLSDGTVEIVAGNDLRILPRGDGVVANVGGVSSAVKFNSLGEAYAVNIGEGIVLKLDLSGADAHEVILDVEGTIDNIAFSSDDVLFVAVGADNEIIRIRPNGHTRTITRRGLGLPGDVAVSPDGTVWVTELFAMNGFTNGKTPTTSFYDRFSPPGAGFAGTTMMFLPSRYMSNLPA